MKNIEVEYVNLDENLNNNEPNIFDDLIMNHEQQIMEMKEPYNQYIQKMDNLVEQAEQEEDERLEELSNLALKFEEERIEELNRIGERIEEDMIYDMEPRKEITVKLFPNTHKELKLMAVSKDKPLKHLVTSIVENAVNNIDIIKHVVEGLQIEDPILLYHEEQMKDNYKMFYDLGVRKKVIKKTPRKRINVKVNYPTYRMLAVMAAVQDRTLDNIVSEILENETGVTVTVDEIKNILNLNKNKK